MGSREPGDTGANRVRRLRGEYVHPRFQRRGCHIQGFQPRRNDLGGKNTRLKVINYVIWDGHCVWRMQDSQQFKVPGLKFKARRKNGDCAAVL